MDEKTTATDIAVEKKDGSDTDNVQDAVQEKTAEKTFTQTDVNKIVSDRVNEANKKWQEKMVESEKISKMTAEQKAEHEKQKKEKEYADREKNITARELKMTAKEILAEKGLPLSLAQALDYTDTEKCTASIEVVEKVFREAVDKAVSDRIKSSAIIPKTGRELSESEKDAARKVMGLSTSK